MVVFVDVKNGKVELTKKELEKILKEEYDKGYKKGKEENPNITYTSSCPYGYNYWSCPYPYKWHNTPCWPWYSTSTGNTITANGSTTSTIPSTLTSTNTTTTATINNEATTVTGSLKKEV